MTAQKNSTHDLTLVAVVPLLRLATLLFGITRLDGAEDIDIRDRSYPELFQRGDVNGDGVIDITDAAEVIGFLFLEAGPLRFGCMDALDANDDGTINLGDPIRILFYLFEDRSLLLGPQCVMDLTMDPLRCESYRPCGTPPVKTGPAGMELVFIPPGVFQMGSPTSEIGRLSIDDQLEIGEDLHQVTLRYGFYMGRTEVTQSQYTAVMGDLPPRPRWYLDKNGDIGWPRGPNVPVVFVNWFEAVAFFKALSGAEKDRFRLPTEAEWEYSCRAGTSTRFHFGDALGCPEWGFRISPMCNAGEYVDTVTEPDCAGDVARFKPNAWGLFDMHGNATEWCKDTAGRYPWGPVTDPQGPISGTGKIMRGYEYYGVSPMRSASRRPMTPDTKLRYSGIRIVEPVAIVLPGHQHDHLYPHE